MPSYQTTTSNSDVSPFTLFNFEMNDTGASGTHDINLSASQEVSGGWITPAGVPFNDNWPSGGSWLLRVDITGPNSNIDCTARCVMLDSGGNILQSGTYPAEQSLTNDKSFTPTVPSWTGGNQDCGNRIAVEFKFRETSGSPQSITIAVNTARSVQETDVPEDVASCTTSSSSSSSRSSLVLTRLPLCAIAYAFLR